MLMAGRKMMNKWMKWFGSGRELLCSLLFPPRCPVCDEILVPEEVEDGIHSACKNKLLPILGAVCMHCGRPIGDYNPKCKESEYDSTREYCYDCMGKGYTRNSNIVQAKSLYLYRGAIKISMYRFKYSNKREYADFYAKQAVLRYGEWMKRLGVEVIVPVPMYLAKQRKRGYNQAECFARKISEYTGVPMNADMVKRTLDTAPQKNLDEKQRKNNLKKAFQSGKNVVQYNCAMVVDDIYTTGSTAEAVACELIKQGTHRVYLLTMCIGGDM